MMYFLYVFISVWCLLSLVALFRKRTVKRLIFHSKNKLFKLEKSIKEIDNKFVLGFLFYLMFILKLGIITLLTYFSILGITNYYN